MCRTWYQELVEKHRPSPALEGLQSVERQTLGPGTGLALGKRPWEAHRAAASKGFTDFAPVCDIGIAMPITDEEMEAW